MAEHSIRETWYYIKPDGHFYHWDDSSHGPLAREALNSLPRVSGLNGTFITAFGGDDEAYLA